MNHPTPTPERLREFAEFVRLHWDGENLADAFRDYGDYPPLHPLQMEVLANELAFRRVMAE